MKWENVKMPSPVLQRQNCKIVEKRKYPRYHELVNEIKRMKLENKRLRNELIKWWSKK